MQSGLDVGVCSLLESSSGVSLLVCGPLVAAGRLLGSNYNTCQHRLSSRDVIRTSNPQVHTHRHTVVNHL